MNAKDHWEKVYSSKQLNELSWYQPAPETSLQFTAQLHIPKNARIIDIGAGDSLLADHLLVLGYNNITVLDISAAAINRAKARLGAAAARIKWVGGERHYSIQYRRTVRFLARQGCISFFNHSRTGCSLPGHCEKNIAPGGKMVIGTLAGNGPDKCSGLPVKQYNENTLTGLLKKYFKKILCITTDHLTPFDTIQHFLFCSFQKTVQ